MTRYHTFIRSAVFAAVAAGTWLPWAVLAGSIIGLGNARALFLAAVTVLYIAGLSPHRARGLRTALGAAAAAGAFALVARTTGEFVIGLALILGVARSAFLYRTAPARAVAREVALLLGGLLFGRFLAAASPFATPLAVWGFLLVQSLFFLTPDVRARGAAGAQVDPFAEAHARALALLDRAGL